LKTLGNPHLKSGLSKARFTEMRFGPLLFGVDFGHTFRHAWAAVFTSWRFVVGLVGYLVGVFHAGGGSLLNKLHVSRVLVSGGWCLSGLV
jgi:hypothetical protein